MKLSWLKSALDNEGPFVSVYLDTTRIEPTAADELATRWRQLRDELSGEGAPEELLDQIEETVLAPPSIGGRHGRAVFATGEGILVDRVLPVPPHRDCAHFGEAPQLLPLLQLTPYAVSQLLVEVDRAGADLHLRAPESPMIAQAEDGLGLDGSVDGGHDELHKASNGGGAQRGWRSNNFQARVEDSWERNAEAVADTVNRVVAKYRPDMLLLTGDVRAQSLLEDELGQEAKARLHTVDGGTRGVSLERASFRDELSRVTQEYIDASQHKLADRFHEAQLRGTTSVAGVEEVALVLERGQVEELLFVVGQEPERIEELLQQAVATDAGICALHDDITSLPEGIGALLRWRDGATPSNSAASMIGDPRREDAVDPERDEFSPHEQQEGQLRS